MMPIMLAGGLGQRRRAYDPHFDGVRTYIRPHGPAARTTFPNLGDGVGPTYTAHGDAQVSGTGIASWGGDALILDGTGDYVTGGDSTALSTYDFTIEMFFRISSVAGNQNLWDNRASVTARDYVLGLTGSTLFFNCGNSGPEAWEVAMNSSSAVSANVEYFVAVNRTGSAFRMYLGLASASTAANVATATWSGQISYPGADHNYIGARVDGANRVTGKQQLIRLTIGTGRYPSTCPVPKEPFPDYL